MGFIIENKEWIFSGIGVLVISTIFGVGITKYIKNNSTKSDNSPIINGNKNRIIDIKRKNEK